MSYQIGLDTLHLRPTVRVGHCQICFNQAVAQSLGVGRASPPNGRPLTIEDAWQMDLICYSNDGPRRWSELGRVTMEGHGSPHEARPSPFLEVEQVLAFDAIQEYRPPEASALAAFYENAHREIQVAHPHQVVTGGYHKTLLSGAIAAFGWEMLLQAAGDRDGFDKVLDGFFRLSQHHFRAWARTPVEAFVCNDDLMGPAGPLLPVEFCRRAVFPRYEQLWSALKAAGKKVLYRGKGDYTRLASDLAAAGADGFIFEPAVNLDQMVEQFGETHVLVGSKVDGQTLAFGTPDQIRYEIDQTLAVARQCPGFFFSVGGGIGSEVPAESALLYFDHLQKNWRRRE